MRRGKQDAQQWLHPPPPPPPPAPTQAGFRIAAHPSVRAPPLPDAPGRYLQRAAPAPPLGAPPPPRIAGAPLPGAVGLPPHALNAAFNHPALANFHLASAAATAAPANISSAAAGGAFHGGGLPLPRADSGASLGSLEAGLSKAELRLLLGGAPDQAQELARLRATLGQLSADTGVAINAKASQVRHHGCATAYDLRAALSCMPPKCSLDTAQAICATNSACQQAAQCNMQELEARLEAMQSLGMLGLGLHGAPDIGAYLAHGGLLQAPRGP